MSDRTAAGDLLRPREQQEPSRAFGGLGVVVNEAGKTEDVEVLDFEAEDAPDALPETEGEVIEAGEEEEECAPRRVAPDPGAPSQQDVDEHEIDHTPYRSWCDACVEGRGIGDQHRAGPEGRVPVVSFDYLLITTRGVRQKEQLLPGEVVLLKILVVKDSKSKVISAHVVACKGVDDNGYAVEKLKRDILWFGYRSVILKSDNEPAIVTIAPRSTPRDAGGGRRRRDTGPGGRSASGGVRLQGQRLRGKCQQTGPRPGENVETMP